MSIDSVRSDFDFTGAASRKLDARESLRHVLAATFVTIVLWFLPFVGVLLVPIRWFVTYVHEICHAVAAVCTLGWPLEIEIYMNAAGLTHTTNMNVVVASAGYVGTPIVGAALLLAAARRRSVRPTLVAAGAVLGVVALWLAGNVLAWVLGLVFAATLVVLGLKGSPRLVRFALSFLALQCILDALADLKTLFFLSVASEVQTDARNMAMATHGLVPAVFWTVLWAGLSVVVLLIAIRLYYRATVAHIAPS